VKKKKKDELETGLEDGSALSRRPSLTASDVQAQEFRTGLRGYNEKDVDAFLDRITEEFEKLTEENQRLRGGASLDGGTEIADAARAAEEIRSKARQEAAQQLSSALRDRDKGLLIAGEKQTVATYLTNWLDTMRPIIRRTFQFLTLPALPHLPTQRSVVLTLAN
jgi:DivIVA domain-containing protein